MNKDLFEIKIREQLTNAKATVPKGAWEAIKSQIPGAGATTVGTGSIGSFGFGFGIATGVAILASLGVYSELKEEGSTERNSIETALVEMNESLETKIEERTDIIDFNEAEQSAEIEGQNSSSNVASRLEEGIKGQLTATQSPTEDYSDKAISPNTPEASLTPANTIDSSELAQMNVVTNTDDRDLVIAEAGNPSVDVSENFKAEIMTTSKEGYAPLSLKLHNSGSSGESVWDVDGKTSKGNIVETTFEEAGTYNVYLTVYDEEGNVQAEDQIEIWVKEGSDIKLPNIFTPNGDGLNDTYRIGYAKNIKEFFIQISDETGRAVYTSTDTAEEWVYDQNPGTNNRRYTVQYRAIGEDGKVHTDQFPLIIVTD